MKKGVVIAVVIVLVKLYQIGSSHGTALPNDSKTTWSVDLAAHLGNNNPSHDIVAFINAWQQTEGGNASFNPINTTQEMLGGTCYNIDPCVKNYLSYEDGIQATVLTLKNDYPGYSDIVYGIQHNDESIALQGLKNSPWGTQAALVEQITHQQPSGSKYQITEIITVGARFDSGECTPDNPWNFQYDCKHWGTDYMCPEGCPGFMPFSLVVTSLNEYGPGPTMGQFIQGTLPDESVLYIGHIKDRGDFVVGQVIPAGTIFGYTNEYGHFHVQLAPPGNFGPCAQTGTCVDFEQYFESH